MGLEHQCQHLGTQGWNKHICYDSPCHLGDLNVQFPLISIQVPWTPDYLSFHLPWIFQETVQALTVQTSVCLNVHTREIKFFYNLIKRLKIHNNMQKKLILQRYQVYLLAILRIILTAFITVTVSLISLNIFPQKKCSQLCYNQLGCQKILYIIRCSTGLR